MHGIEAAAPQAGLRSNPLRRRLVAETGWAPPAGDPYPHAVADVPDPVRCDDVAAGKLAAFFGPQGATFLAHCERRAEGGGGFRLSWSWAAFFSGHAWYFYRKMYIPGIALLLAPIIVLLLFPSFGWGSLAATVVGAGVARSCYVNHALATIRRLEAGGYSGEDELGALQRAGGTSLAGGLLGAVLLVSTWILILVGGW